jgi:hypothetical protein
MAHFGENAKAVQGNWFKGTNLDKVNELTAAGMELPDAVAHAWTATRAAKLGFNTIRNIDAVGTPGNYSYVTAEFWR